jgi:hypothetical protein
MFASIALRLVLLDTFVRGCTLKVPLQVLKWKVLLPVFERYSPMNLLVRYRTVRAVNIQSRDKQ